MIKYCDYYRSKPGQCPELAIHEIEFDYDPMVDEPASVRVLALCDVHLAHYFDDQDE